MGSASVATSSWWDVCRQRDRVLLITNFYKILGGAFFFFPLPLHSFIVPPSPQAVWGGVTAQGQSLAIRPPPHTSNGTWSCSCCSSPFPSPAYIRPFMLWNRAVFPLFQIIPPLSKTDQKELQEKPWILLTGILGTTLSFRVRSSESLYLGNCRKKEQKTKRRKKATDP